MKQDERLQALKILIALLTNNTSLSQLMPASADLSPMTKEICFGFCRHYLRLEAIADCLIDKRPKSLEVWVALLMGIYQLQYMHLPDYAVVKETVALLEKIKKDWAKGLVNAVLRNFCRKQQELLASLINNQNFIYGQPQNLLQHFKKDWPQDWQLIAEANDAHPPMSLRVNLSKISVIEYLSTLEKAGIEAFSHQLVPSAITLKKPCNVHNLPGFAEGLISVQDAAAQLAVSLLDLHPGVRVLDACCAPGGKTCHILEAQSQLAECVALDIEPKRLNRVQENLDRLTLKANLVQGDALFPERWWNGHLFERILVDAPCSATGVIRRHADIKLLRTDEEINAVIKIQAAMLIALWPLLAPGGLMVYATCSVIAEENEQQIAGFKANYSDCKPIMAKKNWGRATDHGVQILPGDHGMDGFFYSVLLKENKQ